MSRWFANYVSLTSKDPEKQGMIKVLSKWTGVSIGTTSLLNAQKHVRLAHTMVIPMVVNVFCEAFC